MLRFGQTQELITRGSSDLSSSCLMPAQAGIHLSLPCPLIIVPGAVLLSLCLLCSFPLVCMGGKVTWTYEIQTGEIVSILKCVYWKLGNSMWEGISCNRIKFNYLQPKVVNIEQFKEQFPFFFQFFLASKIKKKSKEQPKKNFLKEWKHYCLKKQLSKMCIQHISLKLLLCVPAAVHVNWPNTSNSVWSCHEDN